jgi:hypothetical protein
VVTTIAKTIFQPQEVTGQVVPIAVKMPQQRQQHQRPLDNAMVYPVPIGVVVQALIDVV